MGKKARTLLVIGLLTLVVTLGCIGRPKTTLTPEPTPIPTPSPEVEEQLDRAQAIDILVDEVIKPDTLDYNLIVFTLDEPLPQGAEVAAYAPDPLPDGVETLPYLVPETMTAPTWFFWIDDNPFDQFSHPTRFVFIDAENGDVEISYQGWWPYIDGEYISQWVDTEERWDSGNWAFSNVPADEIPQNYCHPNRSSSQPDNAVFTYRYPILGHAETIGAVQRGGKVVAQVVPDVKRHTLVPFMARKVSPNATLFTDEFPTYDTMARFGYKHKRIDHHSKVYVRGNVHTNSIEGFWSLVKRGISGVYHSVSPHYLQSYINEYAFRYNHRKDETPMFKAFLYRIS